MNFVSELKSCYYLSRALVKVRASSRILSMLDTDLSICRDTKQFNQILCQTITTTLIKDTYAASKILNFTAASSFINLDSSLLIFNQIENPNGFICNTMMKAYLRPNFTHNVMNLYKHLMLTRQISPDDYTYPILIQACNFRLSALEGNQVHVHVLKMGFCCHLHVRNTLMNMYAVCDDMSSARQVLDQIPVLDSVSWNTILAGYVLMGDLEKANEIYSQMPEMNVISYETRNLFGSTPEIDMVSLSDAIACYEHNELYPKAVAAYKKMTCNGNLIDEVLVLSASDYLNAIDEGRRQVHGLAFKISFDSYVANIFLNTFSDDLFQYSRFRYTMLNPEEWNNNNNNSRKIPHIHMWGKRKSVATALPYNLSLNLEEWKWMIYDYLKDWSFSETSSLFCSIPKKDVVSWSAMTSMYAQHDLLWETLALLKEMLKAHITPDETAFVSVVSMCAHEDALIHVKSVDAYLRKNGLKINNIVGTILIHMYMKCGCVEDALQVFNEIEGKEVSAWNAVILGLANNGSDNWALEIFWEMEINGIIPDEITLYGVMVACRNMKLVNESKFYFDLMEVGHKNVKHYDFMVDLLLDEGFDKEANVLISNILLNRPEVEEDELKEADIFMEKEAKYSRMAMGHEQERTQDWK